MLISDGVGVIDVVVGGDDMKEGLEGGLGGGLPSPSGLVGIVGGGGGDTGDDGDSCCSPDERAMGRLDNDASKASAAPRLERLDGVATVTVDWS